MNEGFCDNQGRGLHHQGPSNSLDRHMRGGRLWMDVVRVLKCTTCGHEQADKHREYNVEMVYHRVWLFISTFNYLGSFGPEQER